jgi:hypothetical protein
MADSEGEQGFLSRWSHRKAQARLARQGPQSPLPDGALPVVQGPQETSPPQPKAGAAPPATTPAARSPAAERSAATHADEPAPTLADVEQLTPESDFTRFVASDVQTDVKNAALKKLFSDPHFNRMDGLDVYIDDYNLPDPLPSSLILKMAQAKFLGLLTEAAKEDSAAADASKHGAGEVAPARADSDNRPADRIAAHENADLQLQPHDDAGRPCAKAGVGGDTGREH